MSDLQRLLTIVASYMAAGAIAFAAFAVELPSETSKETRIDRIPTIIGKWAATDLPPKEVFDFYGFRADAPLSALIRTYHKSETEHAVVLNVIEDRSGFQRAVHDPRVCYESRGWTVLGFEDHLLELDGNRRIRLKRVAYASSLQPAKRIELYGYLVGNDVIVSDFDLMRVRLVNRFKRLAGGARPHILYVGISTEMTDNPDPTALKVAERIAQGIFRALLPS